MFVVFKYKIFGIFSEVRNKRRILKTGDGTPISIPILVIDEIEQEIISKGRGYYQMKINEKITPDIIRKTILESQYLNYISSTKGQEGFPYKDIKIELYDIVPTPDPYLVNDKHLYSMVFENN